MGNALASLGRHAQALPYLERAVGLDPQFALAWLSLGTAHQALRACAGRARLRSGVAAAPRSRVGAHEPRARMASAAQFRARAAGIRMASADDGATGHPDLAALAW